MKTTIVNLRYKMNEILKALDRRENVEILYHGKLKGTIIPTNTESDICVASHPFFGIAADQKSSPQETMKQLRGPRYDDI